MTAATGRVFGPKPYGGDDAIPHALPTPLGSSVQVYRNWLLGVARGATNAVAQAAGVTDLVSLGFADRDNVADATAGASHMVARQSFVSGFPNSTESNDAILSSDIAVPCYAVDNQTVGKKSNHGGTNRSLLGLALGIDTDNNTPIIYPGPIGWLLGKLAMMSDATNVAEFAIADAAANTATAERAIPSSKIHGLVSAIQFVGAAVAADNTDYVTITVSKRDGAGGAAVVLGTYDSRAANQGAVTAFVPAAFSLSAVAGALNVLETDIITLTVVKGGSGKTLTGAFRVITKVG